MRARPLLAVWMGHAGCTPPPPRLHDILTLRRAASEPERARSLGRLPPATLDRSSHPGAHPGLCGRSTVLHRNSSIRAPGGTHDRIPDPSPPGGGDRLRLRRPVRCQAAQARRRGRHGDQPDDAPPVPAAAVPGRDRHPVRGRDRARPRARCSVARTDTEVLLGEVIDVDLTARTVTSTAGEITTVTPYDSLIVAAGASTSYFGNDEFAEFAPGLKSIDDALELRGRILSAFEYAELETDDAARDEWLTFAVVGAGATGVEMAGQISGVVAPHAGQGLPQHRHPQDPHRARRRARRRPRRVRDEAVGRRRRTAEEDGHRGLARREGRRGGRAQPHRRGQERAPHGDPGAHRRVGRRAFAARR